MKYYLIVGEASGDLHASHLMAAIKRHDPKAMFRFFGGDQMAAEGGTLVRHYRQTAYMGFVPVITHLPAILGNMRRCRKDILMWWPDVVILVDYPGFNLSIAKYVHAHTRIPVFYYISPKIWAWKGHRIKAIRRDVDELFSILPFEVDFFERKHRYPIHYVGNPTVDEVAKYRRGHDKDIAGFIRRNGLSDKPIIALLAGSRRQEIADNLPLMLRATAHLTDRYQMVLAAAPGIDEDYYCQVTKGCIPVRRVSGQTYDLLQHAEAALVTSGTATLETALFEVPQVVCYYTACGRLVSWLRARLLKVKYISLVNLIADAPVVPELVADGMTVANVRRELERILPGTPGRKTMLDGYAEVVRRLGKEGAPDEAARQMVAALKGGYVRRL